MDDHEDSRELVPFLLSHAGAEVRSLPAPTTLGPSSTFGYRAETNMKTAIVSRVRKLIALAGSPNEHEARSSAWLAVKAIRENGLEVVEAGGGHEVAEPLRAPPPRERVTDVAIARTDRAGWCAQCRERYSRGDWCGTSPSAQGEVHAECASLWTVEI